MDKLLAMRTFVEIVDRGSLTAAAAALDRAPPTMVRTLAQLENALGVRLLRRTTRRMTLTEEGTAYLARCRSILADVAEAEQAVSAAPGTAAGQLKLTAPVLFGHTHVMPAVTAFAERHRDVHLDVLLLDRVVNLVEEGLDLGVRIGTLEDSAMVATTVGHMRRVVVASPALLKRVGVPREPRDLEGQDAVIFRGLTAGTRWPFAHGSRRFSVNVTDRFRCNQASAAVAACAAGLGFASLLHYQAAPLLRTGELQIVLETHEVPALPVSLIYADARLMSTRLRLLLDWLKPALRRSLSA